jgi:hypothetical protein
MKVRTAAAPMTMTARAATTAGPPLGRKSNRAKREMAAGTRVARTTSNPSSALPVAGLMPRRRL